MKHASKCPRSLSYTPNNNLKRNMKSLMFYSIINEMRGAKQRRKHSNAFHARHRENYQTILSLLINVPVTRAGFLLSTNKT